MQGDVSQRRLSPEERRDPILGVYPCFWACFSTGRVVFGLGARGDSPKGWQHKSRRRRFLLTPIRRKLQIDFYVASRLRAVRRNTLEHRSWQSFSILHGIYTPLEYLEFRAPHLIGSFGPSQIFR
jgi:hypothetical protein